MPQPAFLIQYINDTGFLQAAIAFYQHKASFLKHSLLQPDQQRKLAHLKYKVPTPHCSQFSYSWEMVPNEGDLTLLVPTAKWPLSSLTKCALQ